jgi:hypothetical protein
MPLDGIERIDEENISVDGFSMQATPEEEETLRKMNKEQRYNYIKKLGQK